MTDAESFSFMHASADAYARHVGRYGNALSRAHAEAIGVTPGQSALDVGCGPGAFTSALAERLGTDRVAAVDPSEPFVDACRRQVPGVDIRLGSAEELPDFGRRFDAVSSQLVLNFMADAPAGVAAMRAAARPGGRVASVVWDYADGMTMLRRYWDAALSIDPEAPDEGRTMRFCNPDELRELWEASGLEDVETSALGVEAAYTDFDDYWEPFTLGVGPSGAFCTGLASDDRERLRAACHAALGSPDGPFSLSARAWLVQGRAAG